MEIFLGFLQFEEESPLKYSHGKMMYLNASCHGLGESEGLFELHRAQNGD